MTLTEFLVLQVAEDETDLATENWWFPTGLTRVRLEAECEAKRRIIDLHAIDCWVGTGPDGDDEYFCAGCMGTGTAGTPDGVVCPTLAALAVVYADRPGYLDEWRRP
jgi:hypothetical protein